MIDYLDKTFCFLHEFYEGDRQAHAGDIDSFLLILVYRNMHA